MFKKLINITAILGITLFCSTNTYATTLKEIFSNENNTIDFTGDIIKKNGTEITDDIESEYFMITSNNNIYTTHINTNTLPIQNSIGRGVVLTSISGSNNIFLQHWTEDSTVPTSITFSGNNTNYTGTLYLHPAINTITFANENSVIRNINFTNSVPNPDTEDTDNPFIEPSERRKINLIFKSNDNNIDINELKIVDNLTLNLIGNLNINKLNLSNKSLLKLVNSNITITKLSADLQSINITSEKYVPIDCVLTVNIDYIISAKFDYNEGDSGKCIYRYPTKINCNCGNEINLNQIDASENLLTNDEIISTIGNVKCNNCKNKTINLNIILWSYLYPKSVDRIGDTSSGCWLYCSICSNEFLTGFYSSSFDNSKNEYTSLSNYKNNCIDCHDLDNCKLSNNDNLKYDYDYILKQLNIGYKKGSLQAEYYSSIDDPKSDIGSDDLDDIGYDTF